MAGSTAQAEESEESDETDETEGVAELSSEEALSRGSRAASSRRARMRW